MEKKPEKTPLQKYWLIVLIIALLWFFGTLAYMFAGFCFMVLWTFLVAMWRDS